MNGFWFRLLTRASRLFGPWLFTLVSRIIAAGFFLFSSSRAESLRFYGILFPERSRSYHLWCVFRQFQNFTTIHLDRFLSSSTAPPSSTSSGWERLEQVIGRGGGILLMSHLGNWEVAARLLRQRRQDLPMLLYMGIKEKEVLEKLQKEELREAGIRIIGIEQGTSSPFSAVDGIRFLSEGGLLSMTGDMAWQDNQRLVEVDFLGHRALLPAAPYVFALLSGAPLFAFFSFRTGPNRYHFTLSEPIEVRASSRLDRDSAISSAARQYARLLEDALREHPLEWYHFERFLLEPLDNR